MGFAGKQMEIIMLREVKQTQKDEGRSLNSGLHTYKVGAPVNPFSSAYFGNRISIFSWNMILLAICLLLLLRGQMCYHHVQLFPLIRISQTFWP
jgi:hypothetical protein